MHVNIHCTHRLVTGRQCVQLRRCLLITFLVSVNNTTMSDHSYVNCLTSGSYSYPIIFIDNYTWCACASEVYGSLLVCLFVCIYQLYLLDDCRAIAT